MEKGTPVLWRGQIWTTGTTYGHKTVLLRPDINNVIVARTNELIIVNNAYVLSSDFKYTIQCEPADIPNHIANLETKSRHTFLSTLYTYTDYVNTKVIVSNGDYEKSHNVFITTEIIINKLTKPD